jgi:hypothetical protein
MGEEKEENRIRVAEIRFLRAIKGCTREGREIHDRIRDKLQIYSIKCKLHNTRIEWRERNCKKGGR